jgi:parvulin-like peptidyl-prolyl isomerase
MAFCANAVGQKSDSSIGSATSLRETEVLASYILDGKEIPITFADYRDAIRNPYFTPADKSKRGEGSLERVQEEVKTAGSRLVILSLARKEGLENDPSVKQEIERQREEQLATSLEKKIQEERPEITEQEIRDQYESVRTLYQRPSKCKIIYVHAFCENPEDAKAMKEAKARAEEALKKIDEGADFVEIAKTYSTGPAAVKGEPVTVDPEDLNPVLAKAIAKMKPGEHTGVLEVRRGYTITQLLERTPPGKRPLEEVRGEIRLDLEDRARKKRVVEYFSSYSKKTALNKFYEKFDEGSDETVLFEFADVKFTKGDFLKAIADSKDKETMASSPEKRQQMLDRILQGKLRVYAAQAEGLDRDATFVSRMKEIRSAVLYQRMLDRRLNERKDDLQVAEQDLREAYDSVKDRLLSDKEVKTQVLRFKIEMDRPGFRPPSKKAQADVYWKARDVMKRVRAGEDFGEITKEIDPAQGDGMMEIQPLKGYVSPFREAIDKLAVGEVSEPTLSDDGFNFLVIKLLEVKEPRQLTFEESKARLEPYAARKKRQRIQQTIADELAAKHHLTLNESNIAKLAP